MKSRGEIERERRLATQIVPTDGKDRADHTMIEKWEDYCGRKRTERAKGIHEQSAPSSREQIRKLSLDWIAKNQKGVRVACSIRGTFSVIEGSDVIEFVVWRDSERIINTSHRTKISRRKE